MVDPVLEDFPTLLESIDVYVCPICERELEFHKVYQDCGKMLDLLKNHIDPELLAVTLRMFRCATRENYTVKMVIERTLGGCGMDMSNIKRGIHCSLHCTDRDIDTFLDWDEFVE